MSASENTKRLKKMTIVGNFPSETFTYLPYLIHDATFSGTMIPLKGVFVMKCESEVSGKAAVDKYIGTFCTIYPRKPLSFTATLDDTDTYLYTFKKGILTCEKEISDTKYKPVSVSPISETRIKEIAKWKKDNKERAKQAAELLEQIKQRRK